MDFLNITFPVSGVETNILIPPLIAMVISFFTSMAGVSGAFLLLPFQMSVLNYTSLSVTGTNHVYNVVAIPSGVYRYIKEGRMAWPLTWVVIAGTLPGVFIGYYIRVYYLPDPVTFKFFVGCVLLFIGVKILKELFFQKKNPRTEHSNNTQNIRFDKQTEISNISFSIKKVEYEFWGETFSFSTIAMFILALIVGIIGGAYGIGGGAIIAPFCVAFFHLPVYTIAGAALMGTFITSFAGAIFFSIMALLGNVSAMPDWPLGILFGTGGFVGMYFGAKLQRFVPQRFIKFIIAILISFLSFTYIYQYIR